MADRYFNVPLGGGMKTDVTEAGSDSTGFACFRVTYDATGNSKLQALKALEAIEQYLTTDTWPPV
jgi:hypothetical protein